MLSARLEGMQRELVSMREFLTTQPPEASSDASLTAILVPNPIDVPRAMFEPVNIDVSIGKVSFGGLVASPDHRQLGARRAAWPLVGQRTV